MRQLTNKAIHYVSLSSLNTKLLEKKNTCQKKNDKRATGQGISLQRVKPIFTSIITFVFTLER